MGSGDGGLGVDGADALHVKAPHFELRTTLDGLKAVLAWMHDNPVQFAILAFLFAWWLYLHYRCAIKKNANKLQYKERREQARVTATLPLPLSEPKKQRRKIGS